MESVRIFTGMGGLLVVTTILLVTQLIGGAAGAIA
jgi:hypothetical protein